MKQIVTKMLCFQTVHEILIIRYLSGLEIPLYLFYGSVHCRLTDSFLSPKEGDNSTRWVFLTDFSSCRFPEIDFPDQDRLHPSISSQCHRNPIWHNLMGWAHSIWPQCLKHS